MIRTAAPFPVPRTLTRSEGIGVVGLSGAVRTADSDRVIAFFSRPDSRSAAPEEAPAPQAFDPTLEGDALGWLGFEHGEPDQPLLDWPRPQGWLPVLPRRRVARNSAPAPAA